MANFLDIDDLRALDAAQIQQAAREAFGVELTGNKPKLLKEMERLINEHNGEDRESAVLSKDVVLENIQQGLLGIAAPQSKLLLNKGTGMVFLNTPALARSKSGKLVEYTGKPVLVNGRSIMASEYVSELEKHGMLQVMSIDEAPKQYL